MLPATTAPWGHARFLTTRRLIRAAAALALAATAGGCHSSNSPKTPADPLDSKRAQPEGVDAGAPQATASSPNDASARVPGMDSAETSAADAPVQGASAKPRNSDVLSSIDWSQVNRWTSPQQKALFQRAELNEWVEREAAAHVKANWLPVFSSEVKELCPKAVDLADAKTSDEFERREHLSQAYDAAKACAALGTTADKEGKLFRVEIAVEKREDYDFEKGEFRFVLAESPGSPDFGLKAEYSSRTLLVAEYCGCSNFLGAGMLKSTSAGILFLSGNDPNVLDGVAPVRLRWPVPSDRARPVRAELEDAKRTLHLELLFRLDGLGKSSVGCSGVFEGGGTVGVLGSAVAFRLASKTREFIPWTAFAEK